MPHTNAGPAHTVPIAHHVIPAFAGIHPLHHAEPTTATHPRFTPIRANTADHTIAPMPEPVDCKYFYGDYFRGRDHEECRLLDASPDNRRPWRRKLCDTCPVPELLRTTTCNHLALEAAVTRRFLRERVEVTFAVCTKHMLELDDPTRCPACTTEDAKLWG